MKSITNFIIIVQIFIDTPSFCQTKFKTICDTNNIKYSRTYVPDDSSVIFSYYINSAIFPSDSTSITESFYNSGSRKALYSYINGHIINGVSMNWYSNGVLKSISNYLYGLLVGGYTEWHSNGKIKTKGNYWLDINEKIIDQKDTISNSNKKLTAKSKSIKVEVFGLFPRNSNGKTGEWYFYDDKGQLIKKEIWNKGKLIDSK